MDTIDDCDVWKFRALQAEMKAAGEAAQRAQDAFNMAGEEFGKKYELSKDDTVDFVTKTIKRAPKVEPVKATDEPAKP